MHPVKVLQEFGTRKIWQKSSIPHSLKARPALCSTLLLLGPERGKKGMNVTKIVAQMLKVKYNMTENRWKSVDRDYSFQFIVCSRLS